MKKSVLSILFTLLIIVSNTVVAQEAISPDRPGLGDGSYIVNPKTTYLESGIQYFSVDNLDQFSFGQIVFRHGLIQGIELRMLLNSFVVQNFPSTTMTGVPDPGVGLKFKIFDMPGSNLRLSGLASLSIPAGSIDFTNDEWIPSIALLADYRITEFATFSWNIGHTFEIGPFPEIWKLTLTPGYSLPGEAGIGIYAGYAGFYSEGENEHFIETGITKHIASFLQLDVNTGLDVEGLGIFVGGGLAMKL